MDCMDSLVRLKSITLLMLLPREKGANYSIFSSWGLSISYNLEKDTLLAGVSSSADMTTWKSDCEYLSLSRTE
jgi:hypothetical protein